MSPDLIHIEGSIGGGQILRSALSLSMLTGQSFSIENIRAQRSRPGLMRQHLTAVRAASELCGAQTEGAELGSTALTFRPGEVHASSHRFTVSGAGSACLVLQTVLPPLLVASQASELHFEGGTHNPLAPPYPFLDEVFFPLIERMGPRIERRLERVGFAPAGGGAFSVRIAPVPQLTPLTLTRRGALVRVTAEAWIANLPAVIGERELRVAKDRLSLGEADLTLRTARALGPGNALILRASYEHATELITGFGERGVTAETVAERACDELAVFLASGATVGEHLSDQLLIPSAMAGAGTFTIPNASPHFASNAQVIERFLPVSIRAFAEPTHDKAVRVEVSERA